MLASCFVALLLSRAWLLRVGSPPALNDCFRLCADVCCAGCGCSSSCHAASLTAFLVRCCPSLFGLILSRFLALPVCLAQDRTRIFEELVDVITPKSMKQQQAQQQAAAQQSKVRTVPCQLILRIRAFISCLKLVAWWAHRALCGLRVRCVTARRVTPLILQHLPRETDCSVV